MSHDVRSLKIIAQPNPHHRERYGSETSHCHRQSHRFLRSNLMSEEFGYPTIEVNRGTSIHRLISPPVFQLPSTWIGHHIYIRVTLVTIVTEEQTERCVHPYSIDTTEKDVIKDSVRNALYFPVDAADFERGVKRSVEEEFHRLISRGNGCNKFSFRISLLKLVQQDLKSKIPLRLFNRGNSYYFRSTVDFCLRFVFRTEWFSGDRRCTSMHRYLSFGSMSISVFHCWNHWFWKRTDHLR